MRNHVKHVVALSGWRRKRLEKQVEKSLTGLKKDHKNYKLHIDLGDAYALLGEAQQSLKFYTTAVALLRQSPNFEKVRNLIIEVYGKMLEIAPEEQKAYLELSEEYIAAGQKERAFRLLLSAAKKAHDAGNYSFALQCYNQVIAKGKTNPHIVERCSELYLKLGKKEDAMQNYVSIGDMYAREEKPIEALEYYKKASTLDKDNPDLILRIVRMYNSMDWTENAATELVRLGEFYEKRENHYEALKYYQNGVRLDPDNDKAKQGEARMKEALTIEVPPEQSFEKQQTDHILQELDELEKFVHVNSAQLDVLPEAQELRSVASETAPFSEEETLLDLSDETSGDASQSQAEDHEDRLKTDIQAIPEDSLWVLSETNDERQPGIEDFEASTPAPEEQIIEEAHIETHVLDESEDAQTDAEEGSAEELDLQNDEVLNVHDLEEFHLNEFSEKRIEGEEPPDRDAIGVQTDTSQVQPEDSITELQSKIQHLVQQLENTEEEKYFLQEQFTAQIHQLKVQETTLRKEITDVYKDKEDVERRFQELMASQQARRQGVEMFDEARYEALVAKIQQKKDQLQRHLQILLKKREENGRFLEAELNALTLTKQRLQTNLTYIQDVRSRLEEKIQTELHQAQQEIQELRDGTHQLDMKLLEQQQLEQELRSQIDVLSREKDALKDNYTEAIDALTAENQTLEEQLQKMLKIKESVEQALKKKYLSLKQEYQQLKTEYDQELQSKEFQINENAQKLSEFADKYVKLEQTFADIRKERDRLGAMLVQETAVRERLENQLVQIETQVESLETQGNVLLDQLGQELDIHFDLEQNVSDEFQVSLEGLEKLLLLQEQEIRSLEVL